MAVASATGVAVGSGPVRAASDGYGESGYGDGGYGGDGGDGGSQFGVSTVDATGVDATSATLEGSLTDLGGADSADCYFEWRRTGASEWSATTTQTLSSTGTYEATLTGLEGSVDYEFRAVGTASDGDADTGGTLTFTTAEDPSAVTTDASTDVTTSGATLHGSLEDLGGAASVDCHFEWRSVGATSWNTTATQTLSAPGSFSADVGGLSGGSEYEFRAVGTASDGDADTSGTASFTTESESGSSAPVVDSYSVTEAGSPNPHAEITADWSVSDADGDLDTVTVAVFDASGTMVDSGRTRVSGRSADGTDEFRIKLARGQTFDVLVRVTDATGNFDSRTRSVTE